VIQTRIGCESQGAAQLRIERRVDLIASCAAGEVAIRIMPTVYSSLIRSRIDLAKPANAATPRETKITAARGSSTRRWPAKANPPKPISIVAQAEGSGDRPAEAKMPNSRHVLAAIYPHLCRVAFRLLQL
jgi:hypothetical protein